jgi:hypothetical protein
MNGLIRAGLREGWQRGILQGRRPWLLIGALAVSARALERLGERQEQLVYREKLDVGSAVLITNLTEEWGGDRAD